MMLQNIPVPKGQHVPNIPSQALQNVLAPPYQQQQQQLGSQHASAKFPAFLRQTGLRTLYQLRPTVSNQTLGLGSSYAPHAFFDAILTHNVGDVCHAQQKQGKVSLPFEMRHALQCVRNAFGDDNLEIFVKKNVDSLEKGATDLLKLTIEQHLKIENLKAQVVLLEVSQAKLSQRCFLELWEDGIRQTDPEIYRVFGLPTYPTATNPFPRPTVYSRTFVWHRGLLVMPKLRRLVVTTITGSQFVNMMDLGNVAGSIRQCFFFLSAQIHNYLTDYDTPIIFSQHCLTHYALPFMLDFLTGLADASAVKTDLIG